MATNRKHFIRNESLPFCVRNRKNRNVRTEIDHLPPRQQNELGRAKQTLMDEFTSAISRATQPWKRNGKILKIILFGSYSRDDWVDEPENGYQSDFDLLVIVSHKDLTDIADYWYVAEDKIHRDSEIARPVNIIVHTLEEVNQSLRRGEYFWVDIARDGILLYDLPGSALAVSMPLTSADAYEMATAYYDEQSRSLGQWIELVDYSTSRIASDSSWAKKAAFNLHQAAETAYACFLLTRTLYFPRSHNIKFLRSLAEDKDPRLVIAWPREIRSDRRRFELVKRAYVEARYSDSYDISPEDLAAIYSCVRSLRDIVEEVSLERLAQLRSEAGLP